MDTVTGLALGRLAVGVVSVSAPATAARLFGLDTAASPQLPYVTRLFGSREIAMGGLTLLAHGTARRDLVLAGVAVDAADAVTGWLGIRDRTVPTATGALLIAPAVGAVVAGLAGARRRG